MEIIYSELIKSLMEWNIYKRKAWLKKKEIIFLNI